MGWILLIKLKNSHYISKNGQDKIIKHADNCLALQTSVDLNEEKNIIKQDATMFPGK